jgi:transposase
VEITAMLAAADRGEIVLGYCDETGFASAHPNRSAWTPVGECHTCEAVRSKRLNVVGALLSSGELFAVKLWETMTGLLFAGFLGLLMQHVGKPLVLILDNASVHTAKEIQPLLKVLQRQGLTLYFLPAYSPELNRIEKLWHKMKYEWMAFKARNAKTIEADVDEIVAGFGERYKMDFC